MRCLLASLPLFFCLTTSGQNSSLHTLIPGQAQPEYFLDRAERQGWIEQITERTEHSSTFKGPGAKVIAYSSAAPVNYKVNNQWIPVDIRPKDINGKWEALNQPFPLSVSNGGDISFYLTEQSPIHFSTTNINGKTPNISKGRKDGLFVWFDQVVAGVSKQIEFRNSCFKYNYVLHHAPVIGGTEFVITENIQIKSGFDIRINSDDPEDPLALVVRNSNKSIMAGIHQLVCYDANGKVFKGSYTLTEGLKPNQYTLKLHVDKTWLHQAAYPVVIDPLVTGPTTTYVGGNFASCFFPVYFDDDSIQITVPAAITVTDLFVTSNYYASPFTTTVMGDGRMYFSTGCNQSTIFQVQPPNGNQPGTAYLEDYDLHSPLMCCMPPQCTSYTFWMKQHLSRTTNGPTCNTTYLYYSSATTWPFSAYVEGYTPESYGPNMVLNPNTLCANECQTTASIYVRYGVPPFTFTHPWSSTSLVWGTPNGCSNANYVKQLALTLPNCPNYCDPSTGLSVPPPVITDACSTAAVGYSPTYNLTIKPVPTLTAADTTVVCSGQPLNITWNDCLGGTSVTWWGSTGANGNTTTLLDTIVNTGNGPSYSTYILIGNLNGCPIVSDTIHAMIYPQVLTDFSFTPSPPFANTTTSFGDISQYNGNSATGWAWSFGDSSFSLLQNPVHIFTEPGEYEVCFLASTVYGCSDTVCKTVQVVPAQMELPNVISPNGDGSNEVLFFKYLDQYESNRLSIFNRWGNLIYEKDNYTNDWKADNVADGTYYYILALPGDKNYGQFLHVMRLK